MGLIARSKFNLRIRLAVMNCEKELENLNGFTIRFRIDWNEQKLYRYEMFIVIRKMNMDVDVS